jgi:rod shape-determining protein MreC
MIDWLARHRFPVVVTTMLLVPLGLMFLSGRRESAITLPEQVAMGVAGWLQRGIGSVFGGVSGAATDYVALVGLHEENDRLKAEKEFLVSQALEAKRLTVENVALRRLLEMHQSRRDLDLVPATLVARELTPFFRVARLSVELDGAPPQADQAVVTPMGLVGRVVHSSGSIADVMLLADTRSRVASEVLGRGILGMMVGSGNPDAYLARFQVSQTEVLLEKGAVIVTSGHDRVFPRGIEIGYVSRPDQRRQVGQYVEYDVVLAVNPGSLQDVLVVRGTAIPGRPAGNP